MAKALAAHRVVVFAREMSLFNTIVEEDCLFVIQALKPLSSVVWPYY